MCNGQCRNGDDPGSVRITDKTIERRFGYHKPSGTQSLLYDEIRASYIAAAKRARDLLPAGEDQRYAVEKIMEAMRAVIAGIACNGVGAEPAPVPEAVPAQDVRAGNGLTVTGIGECAATGAVVE